MDKIVQQDTMLRSSRLSLLEPTIRLLRPGGGVEGLEKCASEAVDFARDITPEAGSTYVLVLALGASEYYGPNRNGDAFTEAELKKHYKTFETGAHVYKSHVNKDPAKKLGDVVKAFYNDKMHRVELILKIDHDRAPDIAKKIREQKDVAVSMGCRIKFDVCSICGNEAASRDKYCTHLKYQMGEILPDGRVVCAYNPSPKFFDISVVWRPADRTGYMLKKIARHSAGTDTPYAGVMGAELGDKVAGLTVIAKALQKSADMEKQVAGVGTDTVNASDPEAMEDLHTKWLKTVAPRTLAGYKKLSSEDVTALARHSLPEVLSTLSSMGIILTTPEFLDLIFESLTGAKAPKGLAASLIACQGSLFERLASKPEFAASVIKSGAVAVPDSNQVSPEVARRVAKYQPSRSLQEHWVTKRAFSTAGSSSYTDPQTGARYVTTPEEIARSKTVSRAGEGASLVGAAALGLITYKALNAMLGVKGALGRVAALLGAGAVGGGTYNQLVGDKTPRVTDQGEVLYPSTLARQVSPGSPRLRLRPEDAPSPATPVSGMGSWVLPTMLLADRMLSSPAGAVKSASVSIPSTHGLGEEDFDGYCKKLGEALLKSVR